MSTNIASDRNTKDHKMDRRCRNNHVYTRYKLLQRFHGKV